MLILFLYICTAIDLQLRSMGVGRHQASTSIRVGESQHPLQEVPPGDRSGANNVVHEFVVQQILP